MRDPNAVVYLVPGVGMITFAKDKATARIAAEFYVNAINVMRGASAVSTIVGLPEQEAFDIEYWLLEEAKLQRMPKPKSLAGRIALVTGGAGGIGSATAERLLGEGACVVLADIDAARSPRPARIRRAHSARTSCGGRDERHRRGRGRRAPSPTPRSSSAASTSSSPMPASPPRRRSRRPRSTLWNRTWRSSRPATSSSRARPSGCCARRDSAARSSSSAPRTAWPPRPAPPPTAPPRPPSSTSPAAWRSKARRDGIRVNVVNPDAVLRGSKIWAGEWLEQRAVDLQDRRGGPRGDLPPALAAEAHRLPEDIAEAVYFFASDMPRPSRPATSSTSTPATSRPSPDDGSAR